MPFNSELNSSILWDKNYHGVSKLNLKHCGIIPYRIDVKNRVVFYFGVEKSTSKLTDFSDNNTNEDMNVICTALRGCRYQSCGVFSYSLDELLKSNKLFLFDENNLIILVRVESDDYRGMFTDNNTNDLHPISEIKSIYCEDLMDNLDDITLILRKILDNLSLISSILD